MGFRGVCISLAAAEVVWFFSFFIYSKPANKKNLLPELCLPRSFISNHVVTNICIYLEFYVCNLYSVFNVETIHFFASFTLFLNFGFFK